MKNVAPLYLMRNTLILFVAFFASLLVAILPADVAVVACNNGEQQVNIGFPGAIKRGDSYCVPINEDSGNIEDSPIFLLMRGVLQFLAVGVGFAVVGGVVWGGFLYMTARGNSAQTQKGTEVMLHAGIALLLYIFMFAILNFLIPGGILN